MPDSSKKKWNHITIDLTPLEAQMLRMFSYGWRMPKEYDRRSVAQLAKKIRATLNPG